MSIEQVIKQPKFKDGYQKAMINLFYTSNYFRDAHLKVFTRFGIQGQHYNILRILNGKYPQPVSPGYIKEVMLDKGRDLTRLIDKLQGMGWVDRGICPDNKRKMNIKLTDEGFRILGEITLEVQKLDHQLKNLTEDEYLMISTLLDKMRG